MTPVAGSLRPHLAVVGLCYCRVKSSFPKLTLQNKPIPRKNLFAHRANGSPRTEKHTIMYISTLLCRLRTYLIFAPSHTHKRFPSPWRVLHGSQGSCSARSLELQGKRAGNGSEDASRKAPASRASLSFCIPQSPRTGRVAFRTRGRCALRHPPFKKNK